MNADFLERYGPYALVTGGAQGLGASFARLLAQAGFNLVLVDRDSALLDSYCHKLRKDYAVDVLAVNADLTTQNGLEAVFQAAEGLAVGLLVNNAGISPVGHFLDQDLALHEQLIAINVQAPMRLAWHFGQAMRERGQGGMIFLSSMSALQGTSRVAHYAATKAYNMNLGESLWRELAPSGIDVLAFLPGQTRTPGLDKTQADPKHQHAPMMNAEETAAEALAQLGQVPRHIPGRMNRLFATMLERLLPRRSSINLVGQSIEKMYRLPSKGK